MVNFILQRGLQASRSRVVYFRHNDINHLEELLEEQVKQDKKVTTLFVYLFFLLVNVLSIKCILFSWICENVNFVFIWIGKHKNLVFPIWKHPNFPHVLVANSND